MRVTIYIIIICAAVFAAQIIIPVFSEVFALTPVLAVNGAWWQFITYMFLHGDPMHIGLNMIVLAIFGPLVERELRWKRYTSLFLLSGLGSALLHMFLAGESTIMMLGASGAVFGVLTAYGFLFPRNWIIMFPGIPMPAILAVFVFAGIELFFGVFGVEPGIANFGHLGGIITGVLFMLVYRFYKKHKKDHFQFGDFEWIWE
ncbi:MAG: rhomboid family intramembrane serine protease [Candidatus Aenigmatarchaeota archaeon]